MKKYIKPQTRVFVNIQPAMHIAISESNPEVEVVDDDSKTVNSSNGVLIRDYGNVFDCGW